MENVKSRIHGVASLRLGSMNRLFASGGQKVKRLSLHSLGPRLCDHCLKELELKRQGACGTSSPRANTTSCRNVGMAVKFGSKCSHEIPKG